MKKFYLTLCALCTFSLSHGQFYKVGSADITQGQAVFVSGQTAYVADGTEGLRIFDVSDKANPTLLSTYTFTGANFNDVDVEGNYAYLADEAAGLIVVDVSDSTNPTFADSVALFTLLFVDISGGHVYAARGAEVYSYDASDPTDVVFEGTYTMPGQFAFAEGIYAHHPYVYTAENGAGGGTEVIDFTNPASPTQLSQTNLSGFGYDIYVVGSSAFVAHGDKIVNINISSGMFPVIMREDTVGGKVYDLFATKEDSFFAINGSNFQAYYKDSTIYDTAINGNSSSDIIVEGGYIYIVSDSLYIFTAGNAPVGIAGSAKQELDVQVYPNPAESHITIAVNGLANERMTIMLTDLTGRVISEGQYNSNDRVSLDVAELAAQMYILKVQTADAVSVQNILVK